ncbi:MAG TPA: hypothetical protein DDZ68_04045 [Parvularcula sp.]|nr:hypothetical protein [Parvularcula sp.]HBS32375.1 hypothetical protein [Parvularcula sp.]HBS34560.1 hypothetical protein [Parvularcula sp.]
MTGRSPASILRITLSLKVDFDDPAPALRANRDAKLAAMINGMSAQRRPRGDHRRECAYERLSKHSSTRRAGGLFAATYRQ